MLFRFLFVGVFVQAVVSAAVAKSPQFVVDGSEQIVVAQNNRDRCYTRFGHWNKVFRPRHPRADRDGCVNKRFLNGARQKVARGELQVLSGHGVKPSRCGGKRIGDLCSSGYSMRVDFYRRFRTAPSVLVSFEGDGVSNDCWDGGAARVVVYPTKIDRSGFTLVAFGYPVRVYHGKRRECRGTSGSWKGRVKAGWIAVGEAR